jgi:hypothetical protein
VTSGKSTPRDLLLGLLFFGSIAALIVITTQLRNWPGTGSRTYVPVLFEDVYGVKKEDRILVHGTTWGRVAALTPIPAQAWRDAKIDVKKQLNITTPPDGDPFEAHVLMTLELDYPLELRAGYTIYAEDANLLGGKVVTILPGTGQQIPTPEDSVALDAANPEHLRLVPFYGVRHPHPITAIGEFVDGNQKDFRDIVKRIKDAVDSATDPKRSTIGLLIADTPTRDRVSSIVGEVDTFTKKMNSEQSLVHDFVSDSPLRKDVNQIIADIKGVSGALDDPDTVAGGLLVKNSPTKQQFDSILGDIRGATDKLNRNDSLVGRAFSEGPEALGTKIDEIVDDVKSMAHDANTNPDSLIYQAVRGNLGASIKDGIESFKNIATKIEKNVIDPVAEGKGILGWLVNDESARKKAERLVTATLGIIEDAREAAPVTSLGSFIFGGF